MSNQTMPVPVRIPKEGTFELTVRCNLHCKMCLFRHDDCENAEIVRKELTTEQWIDMAKQVAEAGTWELLITGGEPMLRPDFCEIWEGIYKQGFVITLYTNATLVTPKIMETLKKYPPHIIGVTIYGASPETYEAVTGSADAFERAIAGIKTLQTLPSRMDYRMTVIQDNYGDAEAVRTLVREKLDAEAVLTFTRSIYQSVRGACADVNSCRMPAGKNIDFAVQRTIDEIKATVGERFNQGELSLILRDEEDCNHLPSENHGSGSTLFGCQAGMSSYTVTWDGNLQGCQMMEPFAREIKGNFAKAWEDFPKGVQLPTVSKKCTECKYKSNCYLCPAVRYAETGTFTEAPEYICKDTEAGCQLIDRLYKEGKVELRRDRHAENL